MNIPIASLQNSIRVQVGASLGMAKALGTKVRHLKLHGAMSNMTSEDLNMALACYEAALSVDPDLIVMVLAATQQVKAVQSLGCQFACEIFADRAYNDDATLVDRSKPGAVIHDPEIAGKRMVEMVKAQAIITETGKHIPTPIDTICLHGDGATAVQIAHRVKDALVSANIDVNTFEGRNA